MYLPTWADPSARASEVAPPATEMLSRVAWATGEALARHEPVLLYQLLLCCLDEATSVSGVCLEMEVWLLVKKVEGEDG